MASSPRLSASPVTASRVLVYRLGSLGDTVVALPAFYAIRRAFPNATLRLLTNVPKHSKAAPAAAVLNGTGLIDGYLRYSTRSRNVLALAALWWQIVRFRPQAVVYLRAAGGIVAARRDAGFFKLCGIARQYGFPLTETLQTNLVQPDGTLEPECRRLLRTLKMLGARSEEADDPASWDLKLTSAEERAADEALYAAKGRPLLALSIGTKMQAKDWGEAKWRALLGEIGRLYPGWALAMVGAAEERAASDRVADGFCIAARSGASARSGAATAPVVNLCGALTPRQSAAVLARARLFIGHDSGPMHLAAAVGTACVAVFSARNIPRVWFPYGVPATGKHRVIYHPVDCMGCRLETCVRERKKCLTSVSVDEVLQQIVAALKEV